MKTIRYGLKLVRTGEILGFYTLANPEDGECDPVEFVLESRSEGGRFWLVNNLKDAEYVKNNSTEWYNASYMRPSHSFASKDLEVVEVILEYK